MERTRTLRIDLLCALVALLAAVSTTSAWPQAERDDPTALRSYLSGNGFLNRGLYDLAASEYRKFLDAYPDHDKAPVARYGLGVSLYRLGRFEDAAATLDELRAAGEVPYAAEVSVVLGQCRLALDAPEAAVDRFDDVLRETPDHELADEAAGLKAEALHLSGRYDEVGPTVALLIDRWPDSPARERAELFGGMADMARSDFASAAERFQVMTERFPDGAYARQVALLLAQSRHRAGDLDRAEPQYRLVVERDDPATRADALYGLATLLHQRGRLDDAGPAIDALLALSPPGELLGPAELLRGRVWFDLGDYDRASVAFESAATTIGDQRDDAAWWLAKCELRRDEPQRAAERLARAIERFPDSELAVEMTYDLGVALVRAGSPDQAIDVLGGFRRAHPTHALAAEALQVMAITEHQQMRYDASLAHCREFGEAYRDHPAAPSILFLAGENLFLDERLADAADVYERYLERYGDGAEADRSRFRLGMARYQLQDFDAAVPNLESVAAAGDTPAAFRSSLLALGDIHFQRDELADAERDLGDYLAFGLGQPAADDALLKLALCQQRQESYEAALQSHRRLLNEFRDSPHRLQASFEAGQTLVALNRPDEAAEAFAVVVDAGAGSRFEPHALNHLGAIAMGQGKPAEAAVFFERTAARADDAELAGEATFQQGQALVTAGRFADAARAFAEVPAGHDRGADAAALRAIATARDERPTEAIDLIAGVEAERMEQLGPDLVIPLLYEKAWCQRAVDDTDGASATYRRILEHERESDLKSHVMLELAELEAEAGRYEPAIMLLRTLRARAEDRTVETALLEQAEYRLGVCEFRQSDHETAAELFSHFVETYSDSDLVPSASLLCSESLFETGHHRRAIEHATRVIEHHPEDDAYGPSLLRAGECHAALQQWPESETAFETFLARFPDSSLWYQARFGSAWARENQGRLDEAMEGYRVVVDRHQGPTAARAQFQIGECLFAEKRYDQAVSELLKVDILYAYPEWSAAALYEAGRCFEEMANPLEARRHFEQLVTQHEETHWAKLASNRLEELSSTSLPGH